MKSKVSTAPNGQTETIIHYDTLLSEEEFLTEANTASPTLAAETYKALVALVDQRALAPPNVYQYARYSWCLSSPDAIIAYRTGPQNDRFWN